MSLNLKVKVVFLGSVTENLINTLANVFDITPSNKINHFIKYPYNFE